MERFRELFANRHERLQELKEKTGDLIFGYLCTYVPEEILYAAGVHPVRIIPETEPITKGEATDVDLNVEHYTHIEEINDKLYKEQGTD